MLSAPDEATEVTNAVGFRVVKSSNQSAILTLRPTIPSNPRSWVVDWGRPRIDTPNVFPLVEADVLVVTVLLLSWTVAVRVEPLAARGEAIPKNERPTVRVAINFSFRMLPPWGCG
jgi:hypothetical protein